MVDRAEQAARRQRLVREAYERHGFGSNFYKLLCFLFLAIVIGTPTIGVIMYLIIYAIVFVLTLGRTASDIMSGPGPLMLIWFIFAVIIIGNQASERSDGLAKAHAAADQLDAAEVAAEQAAILQAARNAEAAREAADAEANRKKWEAEEKRNKAARERATRLRELESSASEKWVEFRLQDFYGQSDPASLKRQYAAELHRRLNASDWAILCESQDPEIREFVGMAKRIRGI
jgi:hypothetical protein